MLLIAKRLKDLSFRELMQVYVEGNRENGQESWPEETPDRQMELAEQDFYDYLDRTFYQVPGAFYAVWQAEDGYVSALRMEPYQDGFLLEALETAPDQRRKGYAKTLIQAVLAYMEEGKIYSHVSRRNLPSLRSHEACGFRKILDHAVYADGSVLWNSVTLLREI